LTPGVSTTNEEQDHASNLDSTGVRGFDAKITQDFDRRAHLRRRHGWHRMAGKERRRAT
jgi:hypothetical protein